MMEAASTSETSVNIYQTTQRNIPEGSHIHTHRRENLQSHLEKSCPFGNRNLVAQSIVQMKERKKIGLGRRRRIRNRR
jgi:hypothetical protein